MFAFNSGFAQHTPFDFKAIHYLEKHGQSEQVIDLLLKASPKTIERIVSVYGGTEKFEEAGWHSMRIPINFVERIATLKGVRQIAFDPSGGHFLMDRSRKNNGIDSAHAGILPLDSALTGKGVVIGFLDAGIYFNHSDFQRVDGSTRIRFIWDQKVATNANAPQPYAYGQEWNWIDIDNGNCTHVEPANDFGHGTNVAGTAAGNGAARSDFKGAAPEAEIIMVAVDASSNFLAHVADGIHYIFNKAEALGKPCIINTSVGTYVGSRDGKDPSTQIIESLLNANSGRALVAAAGNAGAHHLHLGVELENDSAFSWFRYNAQLESIFFELWADSGEIENLAFSFAADDPANFSQIARTLYSDLNDYPGISDTGFVLRTENLFDSGQFVGQIRSAIRLLGGTYQMQFQIFPEQNNWYWRFISRGTGAFDVYSHENFTVSSSIVFQGLPNSADYPAMHYHMPPDRSQNIVSSWQCSDQVITVGNYSNRSHYYDIDSTIVSTGEIAGALFFTSSHGPTRDKRIKPDIVATGSTTISTGNLSNIQSLLNTNQRIKVGPGGQHNRNGGTSLASPVVAGIAALYFEQNPEYSWRELKYALTMSARRDSFILAALPNNNWGYGKVDAFKALSLEFSSGCTDSTAINFDPAAEVDDGNCEPIIEGCTDQSALNYDANANFDDGSCMYDSIPSGLFEVFGGTGGCTIKYHATEYQLIANFDRNSSRQRCLALFDLSGKKLLNTCSSSSDALSIDVSGLAGYFLVRSYSAGQESCRKPIFVY